VLKLSASVFDQLKSHQGFDSLLVEVSSVEPNIGLLSRVLVEKELHAPRLRQSYLRSLRHDAGDAHGVRSLPVTLDVMLQNTHSCDFTQLRWSTSMSGYMVRIDGFDELPVSVRSVCSSLAAMLLSLTPCVTHLELPLRPRTLNDIARVVMQTGYENVNTLYSYGITGSGFVAGIGVYTALCEATTIMMPSAADTGLDQVTCYFKDYTNGQTTPCNTTYFTKDESKRKVVQYVARSDTVDSSQGHGASLCC
jgi:hypothetical protein